MPDCLLRFRIRGRPRPELLVFELRPRVYHVRWQLQRDVPRVPIRELWKCVVRPVRICCSGQCTIRYDWDINKHLNNANINSIDDANFISNNNDNSTASIIPVSLNLTPTTTSTPTTLTTSSTPTTTSTSSTTTSSSSFSATPFTSVTTVTGQVKTLTITPTAPAATATTIITTAKENNGGFFSDSGKVAGTFVAVAIVLLLLIAGAIWFFLRRSRRRQPEAAVLPSIAGSSTPQRRPSRLSQMGLVGAGGTQREKTGPTIPVIQTSGWGPSNANASEQSPADTLSAVDRRSSYPRVVDQRLEPTALWNPLHDNGSHVSVRSFRDDQDYSRRMLRIANPDDG
ncbi:MAG: hypothetical protein Q9161_003664 [Pseudevernia consocians]